MFIGAGKFSLDAKCSKSVVKNNLK
jgi:hypothetical protein